MKKLLFILLVVFLTAYYFFYDTKASEEKNVTQTENINSSVENKDINHPATTVGNKIASEADVNDSIAKNKTVSGKVFESFTGYKITVPGAMIKVGKETQAFGIDGKARNAELRLKDTLSGTMLIIKNIYQPFGNEIFNSKATKKNPVEFNNYKMIADTMVFDVNGKGQKLPVAQKVVDILLKSEDGKVYEFKLKTTQENFDKDIMWFDNTLKTFKSSKS